MFELIKIPDKINKYLLIPFKILHHSVMIRFTIIFFLFSFTTSAQTYLGNNKEEILKKSEVDFKNFKIFYEEINETLSLIRIKDDYEILTYYLINDACVKFEVSKPYSCQCLSKDIMNYNSKLTSIGKFKWVSKDLSKVYQLKMNKDDYNISVSLNFKGVLDVGLFSQIE